MWFFIENLFDPTWVCHFQIYSKFLTFDKREIFRTYPFFLSGFSPFLSSSLDFTVFFTESYPSNTWGTTGDYVYLHTLSSTLLLGPRFRLPKVCKVRREALQEKVHFRFSPQDICIVLYLYITLTSILCF